MRIISDKVYGYIRKYDDTIYLRLFNSDERYKLVFDRIRFFIVSKSNNSDAYCHEYMKIKINSDDDLHLEKSLNIHNLVILNDVVVLNVIILINMK